MTRCERRPRAERGVGLLEILIALLVLSVGFLYTATMQVQAMRANQEAYHHSQALMLASDMMDRMRANPAGVAAGAYDGRVTFSNGSEPTCRETGCSAAQLAELDLFAWSAALDDLRGTTGFVPLLPPAADGSPASGAITVNASGDHVITLSWSEFSDGVETTRSVNLSFTP